MEAIVQAITDFAKWLFDLVKGFIEACVDFLKDLFIWALDGVLGAIGAIIAAIPVPDFLTQYSLGVLFNQMHPVLAFFGSQLHIAQGLGIVAAGFAFRMTRKVLTFFQW